MRKLALHWQILIAIILAFIAGLWMFSIKEATGNQPTFFGVEFIAMMNFVGKIFLNALRMIIVPLITSSIIVGVAGIGSGGNLGALGGKTLLSLLLSYELRDFKGGGIREDDVATAEISADWEATNIITLSAVLRGEERRSNVDRFDFTDGIAELRVKAGF